MRSAATLAIAVARTRSLWPAGLGLLAISAGAGAWLRALSAPAAWLLTSLLATSAIAIAIAYANSRSPQHNAFAAMDEAAPLFGRQRARANAIVPSALVLLSAGAQYAGAHITTPAAVPTIFFLLNAVGGVTALLIALSVPLRSRWNRALYAALSIGGALLCGGLGAAVFWTTRSQAAAAAVAVVVALCVGFVALRQYGEALARYDPLPA